MRIAQHLWTSADSWRAAAGEAAAGAQLVLVFGDAAAIRSSGALARLREDYPAARLVGCSTAGEVYGATVHDGSVVATAVRFESTSVRVVEQPLPDAGASEETGMALGSRLDPAGLVHVLVLVEGVHVNGSAFVRGLSGAIPPHVGITGGLAADGDRFRRTVIAVDERLHEGHAVAVGLYGADLRVGYGSMGGWDPFGPERLITRARANVLYELDGCSALDLYKRYLGPYAGDLPASGLLFPLSLRTDREEHRIVRTILGIDEAKGSLIFAGDVPEGAYAQLMKANVDRLIDGSTGAAMRSADTVAGESPALALLISCVGRKLVLKQRVEEEVESVHAVLGARTALAGFYSYGEIAPFNPSVQCELHNQTMTVTTLSERCRRDA